MEPKPCKVVLNCVAYPGGAECCECGSLDQVVFLCSGCSKTVCGECIDRHSGIEAPAEDPSHVAQDDDRKPGHAE